ncbi:MAG TPA: glycosyltransferase [Cytophagales bacterium]|nr:glycosyltransferase [Cytophagales bacterium]
MHYGIFTIGTRGDVQPYIALAIGLIARGHRVTIVAPQNFQTIVEGHKLDFFPLPIDVEALMAGPEGRQIMKTGNTFRLLQYFYKKLSEHKEGLRKAFFEAAQRVDAIISNQNCLQFTTVVAEKLHKQYALSYFMPPLVQTKAFPAPDMDFMDKPWYNLWTYRFLHWAAWRFLKKDTNEFRRMLGLPALKESLLDRIQQQKILDFYSFSSKLIPRPTDWPAQCKITGFMSLASGQDDLVSASITTWINSGSKPIYVGFGSNGVPNPERFAAVLMDFLSLSSERVIFCEGWSGVQLPSHPKLLVLKSINHDWLLPKCKTAVIHGGAGTIAAVLRAQIPVIVASMYTDQPTWGKIIAKRQVGVHLPFKEFSTLRLLEAIEAMDDPHIRAKAKEMGAAIKYEDGVKNAIEAIEAYFPPVKEKNFILV